MEIGDTSTRPLSIGMGTRRPSLVILTATWRRSLPSKKPNTASVAPVRPGGAVRAVYQQFADRQPRRPVPWTASSRASSRHARAGLPSTSLPGGSRRACCPAGRTGRLPGRPDRPSARQAGPAVGGCRPIRTNDSFTRVPGEAGLAQSIPSKRMILLAHKAAVRPSHVWSGRTSPRDVHVTRMVPSKRTVTSRDDREGPGCGIRPLERDALGDA